MKPSRIGVINKRNVLGLLAIIGTVLIVGLIYDAVTTRITRLHERNASLQAEAESLRESSDQAKQRIGVLQTSVNSVLRHLPPVALASCLPDRQVITDFHLGTRIDSVEKTIDHRKLVDLSGRDADWRLEGVYHDVESLADDFSALSGVEIDARKSDTRIFDGTPDDDSRAFDFVAVLKSRDGELCSQPIRLHFSQRAEELEASGWRIESVIGRSGLGIGRFSLPYGTQFHDGHLWTTDCSNENVSVFSLDGRFKGSFGQFGTRLGRLDTPAALAIVGDYIYVVEERNHRVQKFTLDGTPVDVFGAYYATEDPLLYQNRFNFPLGIAWNGMHLAVVDYANDRVIGIDPDNDYEPAWVSGNLSDNDEFEWVGPYYIRWFEERNVFVVSNRGADEIVLMDPTGKKLRAIGTDQLSSPHELDIDSAGNILVADLWNYRVAIYKNVDDYSDDTVEYIDFPESYGLPKTLTVLPDDRISVGFVGNGTAYFLVLAQSEGTQPDLIEAGELNLNLETGRNTHPVSADAGNLSDNDQDQQVREVYSRHCSSCHENGDYGAPARGNIEAWEGFPRDVDELLAQTVAGTGAMIPRGGCVDCSDDLLRATIEYMLPMEWGRDLPNDAAR